MTQSTQLRSLGTPPSFTCSLQPSGATCAVWPYGTTVKYSLPDNLHPVTQSIIIRTGNEWLAHLNPPTGDQNQRGLSIRHVAQHEGPQVKFSFGDGQSFGEARCTIANNGGNGGHIDFGWSDKSNGKLTRDAVIWTQAELERRAKHVWAHVLGIGHDNQLAGNDLASPANIAWLKRNYPPRLDVYTGDYSVHQLPGYVNDRWENQQVFRTRINTPQTYNTITAISRFDIGTNGDYCIEGFVGNTNQSSGFDLNIGSWQSNTHLHDIRTNVLGFHQADDRIRTGWMESANQNRGGNRLWVNADEKCRSQVVFDPPFEEGAAITVQTWIFRFKIGKNCWLRMNVDAVDITWRGFTLVADTWADTLAFTIGVQWLAHRTNDPTIRSGRFRPPEHNPWASEDLQTFDYSPSPLPDRARYTFHGISHVNVRGGVNARIESQILGHSASQIAVRVGTWFHESKYHSMGSAWIVIL